MPNLTRRRATIENAEKVEAVCSQVVEQPVNHARIFKTKIKIPFKIRGNKAAVCTVDTVPQTVPEVILTFEENLSQNRLAEASRQLIKRENAIFSVVTDEESTGAEERAKDRDQLQRDYEMFQVHLWMVVHGMFQDKCDEGYPKALRSAVTSVMQEEEQDKRWLEPAEGQEVPDWRPRQCMMNHNNLLQKIVESRIKNAEEDEDGAADKLSTSFKKQVCKIGKRVQLDLLKVAKDVKQCYPQELDICQIYARLYHQAFSSRMKEFAQYSLDLEDCVYVLNWVNSYYPTDVLKHKELKEHIDSESLGLLLSEQDLRPLEEQYLSQKEATVRHWLANALKTEEERWNKGDWPELIDEYYISHIAVDVIGLVTPLAKEATTILGDEVKAQRLLCQLEAFLMSYKKALEDFSKGRHDTTKAVLKANLVSIQQFREFVERRENLFKDQTRTNCLSILADLRDYCFVYFLCPIHKELLVYYRRLWTSPWFATKQGVPPELLGLLSGQVHEFRDLKPSCREELLEQLHFEVMVQYVKRIFKKKMKLRDREQQEAASQLLCEDSKKLNTLFTEMGSENTWLDKVLPKLAEIVRLQDPGAIQLEIVTLAREHPDLSEKHIVALLHLKGNLAEREVRRIKESLSVNRGALSSQPAPVFFAKARVPDSSAGWRCGLNRERESMAERKAVQNGCCSPPPCCLHFYNLMQPCSSHCSIAYTLPEEVASLLLERFHTSKYPDDRSHGWERAVVQLSEPVWRELSPQAASLEPQWQHLFHYQREAKMSVNVNRSVSDQFYRYKMPRLIAKVEGKGNGIKTVIVNMVDVAKALNRPPTYPTKFFGCELGAQTQFDTKNDRYIVNGSHEANKLQDMLDGFIRKFVLCPECDNPETDLHINPKKQTIGNSCKACGYRGMLDTRHKLCTFILKNPPENESGSVKKEKEKKNRKKDKENGSSGGEAGNRDDIDAPDAVDGDDDDEDWAEETTEEAQRRRMEEISEHAKGLTLSDDLEKTLEERVNMFYNFVKQKKEEGAIDSADKEVLAEAERLDVKAMGPLILSELLFDENIRDQIKKYKRHFLRFCHNDKKAQKWLLGGFECVVKLHQSHLLPRVPIILKDLYDADLLEEDVILAWAEKVSKKYVPKEVAKEIHAKAEPFVNWLKEAEEESEGSEEEEEEDEDNVEVVYSSSARELKMETVKPQKEEKEEDDIDIDAI
ncbi:hypothetical protein ACEWY4_022076 [Coilia grayii]|uniref:Eukaryotic translation initiation factor 5 n=6 Tax=Euteleostomi TaxID=117571 RepID=A0ABD1J509_9TELE